MVPETLRAAGWRIEKHLEHFAAGTEDVDWIPEVGKRGWVSLTKDKAIRRKPQEIKKVLSSGVRMFTLKSGNLSGADMAAIFVANRLKIARFLHAHPGPFVAAVSQSGVEMVRDASEIS